MTWSGPLRNDASSASPAMAKTTGLRPCRSTAAATSAGSSPPPARMATGPLGAPSVMDRSGVGAPCPRRADGPVAALTDEVHDLLDVLVVGELFLDVGQPF